MAVKISYEPFDRLILSLRNDGLNRESEMLHDMIYQTAWTTGSELMGELGQSIKKIRKENLNNLSDDSIKNMKESMQMVKRAWRGFGEWYKIDEHLLTLRSSGKKFFQEVGRKKK